MRKNIRNDKVIKAITIGLATMIAATSMPANVFAGDTEGSDATSAPSTGNAGTESSSENTSETTETNESSESSADYSAASETVEACNNIAAEISTADEGTVDATDTIDAAYDAVAALAEAGSADETVIGEVQADLTAGKELLAPVGGEDGTLAKASAAITDTVALAHATDTYVANTEASIEETNSQIEIFDDSKAEASEKADEAVANAEVANTSASRTEVYEAKDNAEEQLSVAETELEAATAAYDAAADAADKAKEEYDNAVAEHAKAVKKAEEAKALIESAQINATAAEEQLKAAQAKVAALESKVKKLAENKEELEAIQHQYYAMMVKFFLVSGIDIEYDIEDTDENKNAHKERTVNIEATIEKLKNDKVAINKTAISNDKVYLGLGRYLTKLLVEQMILSDKNVDPQTANIMFGTEGDVTDGKAGTVFTNWDYKAQVTYSGNSDMYDYWHNWKKFKNVDKNEKIEVGEAVAMQWKQTNQGDSGRSNYVTVKYTDKDGTLQTKRYNFIRKNSNYDDDLDIENGMFYLAEVKKGEDGKWHYTRITDNENNYDDYNKLLAAIAAAENIEKYNAAKAAVDEATAKVEKIKAELDNLKNVSVNNSVIEALKDKLDQANKDLAAAKEAKEALEDKVAEAREAVEAIDLSRFDVKEQETEGTTGTETGETGSPTVETSAEIDGTVATADDAGSDSDDSVPTATVGDTGTTITIPGLDTSFTIPSFPFAIPGLTAAAPGTGVLGARTGGATGTAVADAAGGAADADGGAAGEGEEIGGGQVDETTGGAVRPAANTVRNNNNRQVVRLEDMEVPLADIPYEAGVEMSWWWLLIIFLLGANGKKLYGKYQERKEAKNLNK